MKRIERLAIWLLLGYGLCGCTRTKEVHEQEDSTAQATVQQHEEQHVDEVRQSGPETITTTVEEWAVNGVSAPLSALHMASPTASPTDSRVAADTSVVSAPPVLIKRTVTVDQRAPVTETKTAEAKGASTAAFAAADEKKVDAHTETKTGPSPLFWLAIGGGLVVAIGVCWKLGLFAKAWTSL